MYLFFVCYCRLNEIYEKGVWIKHRTLVFGMELRTDIPFKARYLHDFNEVAFRVFAYASHSRALVFLLILAVKLVTVAMSFLYMFVFIYV